MMRLKARNIRRNGRELGRFVQQCFQELAGRRSKRVIRNSDLRHHSFRAIPEPSGKKRRRRLSLERLRNTIRQNRRVRRETFDPQRKGRQWPLHLLPALCGMTAIVLFFVFGGMQTVGGLFRDISVFKIRDLEFVGCEATTEDRLRLLTGINLYQTSLLELDADAVAASVEQDPWVSKAVVKRNWPSAVVIEVKEHHPVAMINRSTTDTPQLYYVDRSGTAFLEVRPGQDVDFPVITGLDRFGDEAQRAEIFADIHQFLKYAERNNPNLPVQSVSEIHVNEEGELVIYLVDHTFPIFFGRGNVYEKYRRLVRVLESLYREKRKGMLISGVEYIRMDYLNDKVLVAQSESS